MAVSKLVLFGLHPVGVALEGNNSAESKILVADLLRRIEIKLAFFGEYLYLLSNFEIALDVLNNGEIVQRSRLDSVEDVDLNQLVFLDFDVNRMYTFAVDTLNDTN